MGKRWLPLESNPDVLNDFVKKLGFDTSKYAFCDVYGLDEVRRRLSWPIVTSRSQTNSSGGLQELLAMVPQPVVAVLLLFPVTKDSEAAKDKGVRGMQHVQCT